MYESHSRLQGLAQLLHKALDEEARFLESHTTIGGELVHCVSADPNGGVIDPVGQLCAFVDQFQARYDHEFNRMLSLGLI